MSPEFDWPDEPISDADKNSRFRGTERRESSIRGSELPEASKSLENMKGDEDILV